jgi:archaellum component FlaC
MSTMIAEVYDALKEAGASEEKAKAAAVALADYTNRFDHIDLDLGAVKGDLPIIKSDVAVLKTDVTGVKTDVADLKTDVAVVRAELAMVKWIVSGVGFGVLLLVLRSFWPA